jgi:predicted short-subunit dehydrogenase-like oxidoreductase (DUF2520 family)
MSLDLYSGRDPRDPMDVGVVGAGRVGTALAVLLAKAGHPIVGASGGPASRERVDRFLPGVPFVEPVDVVRAAEAAVLAVPDDEIATVCAGLADAGAFREGQAVQHLSGSVSLEALDPAAAAGATTISLHPLQTVPTVEAALARLPGSSMAVTARSEEGFEIGELLARDAGSRPFRLPDDRKALYHAAAVFCSNYVTVLAALAEGLFTRAGVEDPVAAFAPLSRAALENALELDPAGALTGPAARGDAGTIRRNLEALSAEAPDAIPPYVALARAALVLADRAGRVSPDRRAAVEEVLARWS